MENVSFPIIVSAWDLCNAVQKQRSKRRRGQLQKFVPIAALIEINNAIYLKEDNDIRRKEVAERAILIPKKERHKELNPNTKNPYKDLARRPFESDTLSIYRLQRLV